jgi:hypothetical protein
MWMTPPISNRARTKECHMTLRKALRKGLFCEKMLEHWVNKPNTCSMQFLKIGNKANTIVNWLGFFSFVTFVSALISSCVIPLNKIVFSIVIGLCLAGLIFALLIAILYRKSINFNIQLFRDVEQLRTMLEIRNREYATYDELAYKADYKIHERAINVRSAELFLTDTGRTLDERSIAGTERMSRKSVLDQEHKIFSKFGLVNPKGEYYDTALRLMKVSREFTKTEEAAIATLK